MARYLLFSVVRDHRTRLRLRPLTRKRELRQYPIIIVTSRLLNNAYLPSPTSSFILLENKPQSLQLVSEKLMARECFRIGLYQEKMRGAVTETEIVQKNQRE